MSNVRILSAKDVESIAITRYAERAEPIVTNTGLSEDLIKELSGDVSSDFIVTCLKIIIDGVEENYCNKPVEHVGIDENGNEISQFTWNGETWLYLPFDVTMDSMKSSGEIVGGSIQIQNAVPKIAQVFTDHLQAIPIKMYHVSRETGVCIVKDEYKYITTITNTGIMLQAQPTPADVLNEQLPSLTFNPYNFRS